LKIRAQVQNSYGEHTVILATNDDAHPIVIEPKASGFGSSANGGELLFLALATCYCNDIYREAAKRGVEVERVEVDVDGQFGPEGAPATNVTYRARVVAHAAEAEIRELMHHTDTLAEIQNTLRMQTPVTLERIEAVTVQPQALEA
jgi:organic hydroperoxide reductase OsmC/OhrA